MCGGRFRLGIMRSNGNSSPAFEVAAAHSSPWSGHWATYISVSYHVIESLHSIMHVASHR